MNWTEWSQLEDNHADAMAALGAMAGPKPSATNVIPLHR